MKRLLTAFALAMLMVPVVFAGHAEATLLGGKWARSGYFTLYYSYGGAHRYKGNVWQGAANWTATPTKVSIKPWPSTPYALHIDVYDTNTSATWWGATQHDPCSTCTYTRARFYLNQRTLDPESDFTRTKVATHEFGHVIGLNHPAAAATSVMNQGRLSYNKPQAYDINDVNRIYK